jgi:uncharacterized repeat protein (TIGR01451 family)
MSMWRRIRGLPLCALAVALNGADMAWPDCVQEIYPNLVAPFTSYDTVFPNWVRTPVATFTVVECADAVCTGCTNNPIVGVTIYNYGNPAAQGGVDITSLYFQVVCGSTNSGLVAMTYAGIWTVGGNSYPAWTWYSAAGIAWSSDPCTACLCSPALNLYADIASCPVDGRIIELGPGYNDIVDATRPGGVTDNCNCVAPWTQQPYPSAKTIRYVWKVADQDTVAPGDTVNYTIYYGRPGSVNLTSLVIFDTLPPYNHLVLGSGVPAPDPGWDPDPGPPLRLRWTTSGSIAPAGGATYAIRFAATVDWGNMEAFEPGSGDVAAPEGEFLFNRAQFSWEPGTSCAPGRTSNTTTTVVKRYMFWKIGDQDLLFAPRIGMPDDEVIYEIFLRNTSLSKTWWNVTIWDTVPDQLDPWGAGFGFDDPCTGWTMTPTGCAAASPAGITAGGKTIMAWRLDMPPMQTLTVRWKARVRMSVTPGATVTNRASVQAYGRPGVVGGTGNSIRPRVFTHEATVVLRTTFTSYVGWSGDTTSWSSDCDSGTQTYYINFYPLNKACDFALYRKWCCPAAPCDTVCAPFALNGGVSPKIDVYAGSCTAGLGADWETGCLAERSPARYIPASFNTGVEPGKPFNFLHKLVSNSPCIWELMTCLAVTNHDANTFAGTTNMSFCGYTSYTYVTRDVGSATTEHALNIINTGEAGPTTLFLFKWNEAMTKWDFLLTKDLYNESQWAYQPQLPAVAPYGAHIRIISSDNRIIVHKGWIGIGQTGAYNDFGTFAPARETGNLIAAGPATFYLFSGHMGHDVAIVGNLGNAAADYDLFLYQPFDKTVPSPNVQNITTDLVSNAGYWNQVASHSVPPLQPVPGATGLNPHVYGTAYDNSIFTTTFRLYKLKLAGGGPLQVMCGRNIIDMYSGGSMMHALKDQMGSINQVGVEFWLLTPHCNEAQDGLYGITTIDMFCPKKNMVVRAASSDNAAAVYTTNDIDECVSFRMITQPAAGARRNWRIRVDTTVGNPGDAVCQFNDYNFGEKFYTAPFLQKGVFYLIISPPVVFIGQSFWITVTVIDSGGGTKTDYCGTSSFTSTDPGAKIETVGLDTYNFTWSSGMTCSSPPDENGVKMFMNVSFTQLGTQTMVASDTIDGSITGLATFMVVGADVKLTKQPLLAVAASGDQVEFRICWSNFSSASAMQFVVRDAVPMGTTYVPQGGTANLVCGPIRGPAPVIDVAYSTAVTTTPPATWSAGNPVTGTRWLRWGVNHVYINSTGCVCFRVSVN